MQLKFHVNLDKADRGAEKEEEEEEEDRREVG